ncbi:MAG: phage portal protein [Fluviibacter sp.]
MPQIITPPPYGPAGSNRNPYGVNQQLYPLEAPPSESGKALEEYIGDQVFPRWQQEKERLDRIGLWMDGKQPYCVKVGPRDMEKRALLELSRSPWLGLSVSIYAQAMYVDGYRSPSSESRTNASPWDIWVGNNFSAHQISVHRSAIGYGYSFVRCLPGEDYMGNPLPIMRGVSAKRMFAMYDDPVADDFPETALELMSDNKTWRWYDDEVWHEYECESLGGKFTYKRTVEHNLGVCPIVRYVNQQDLDGRCIGDVEPVIAVAARIDKTDYDRLLVQHYNSWKVRTATGLEQADSDADRTADKRKLAQDDMLVSSDPNVTFGSLPETNLAPFIAAHESDVESLASMEQLPSHLFTGKVINVSAEALAASRAMTTQKLLEKQTSMGVSHARLLRLAAGIAGDTRASTDFAARVSWQDVEVRSLAQAADAYGKVAQQLGVPKEFLWRFIPGFDATDVQEMRDMALDNDPLTKYLRDEFGQKQQQPADQPVNDPAVPSPGPVSESA